MKSVAFMPRAAETRRMNKAERCFERDSPNYGRGSV